MSEGPAALPPPAARRAPRARWHVRWLGALSTSLPLLVMAALALFTLWLVNQSTVDENAAAAQAPRHEPDYTMRNFTVQRFAPDGSLRTQIEGDTVLHYPATDTLEIENPRVRSIDPSGRVTLASSQRALSNGDGSEVQLLVAARVVRGAVDGEEPVVFSGEFLHLFSRTEQVRSHLPVLVRQGTTEVRAEAMQYDHLTRVVAMQGPMRAVFPARAPRARP